MRFDTEAGIQWAIANLFFDPRLIFCVPNVSWGMFRYEHDLVAMTKSGYCWEIEIKVSKADVKKDLTKRHGHRNNWMKRLYFAIPESINKPDVIELIPERAGIIVVRSSGLCSEIRQAKENRLAKPLDDKRKFKLARLHSFRYWRSQKNNSALYDRIEVLEKEIESLRDKNNS